MATIKIVLFDVDGVIINLPHYFSRELEEQGYEGARENLDSFFQGEDCRRSCEGKADAQTRIKPYLSRFGWTGTAKDYFRQQFEFEKKYFDSDLMNVVAKLRKNGIKCYLSTDQIYCRAKFLLDEMNFRNLFDGHFISCDIGFRKCHNEFWEHVMRELKKELLKVNPEDILYFDDAQNNVNVALKFGIQAEIYQNIDQVEALADHMIVY